MAQMQSTLASLITRTRRWLNEPTESKSFWSDNFIKEAINSSYRLRCAELHMAYEGQFVNVAERDLTKDQDRYAWPPNMQRLHKLELVRSDGRRVPIQRYERHDSPNFDSSSAAGGDEYRPTFRPVGSGFELEPGPNTTVTDGLRIEYYGIPVELEEDSDTLHADFPSLFNEMLVIDAAITCINTEYLMDGGQGLMRTIEIERRRYEERWERYIDGRIVGRSNVQPFKGPYIDS
jgi:hypothetical protein